MAKHELHRIAEELDLTLEPWQWELFTKWLEAWDHTARALPDPAIPGLAGIDHPRRPRQDA